MSASEAEEQVQQCIHRELYAARALFPVSDGLLLGKKFGKWAKLQMRDNKLLREQARLLKLSDYMDAIIQGRIDKLSLSTLVGLAGVYLFEDQVQDLDKYTRVLPEADNRCLFELLTFPYKRAPKEPPITLVARCPRPGCSHLFVLSPRALQAVEACFYALLLPARMQVLFKETASPGGTAPHVASIQAWLLMKAKILDPVVHEATQLRIFCSTRIPSAIGARWNGVLDCTNSNSVPRGGLRALELYGELHHYYAQPNYEPCMTVAGIDPPHVIIGRTTPLPKPITPVESDLIYLSAGLSIFMQFLSSFGVELTVKTAMDMGFDVVTAEFVVVIVPEDNRVYYRLSPPSDRLPFEYTDLKYYNVLFNVTTALVQACPHMAAELGPVLKMFSATLQRRQDEIVAPDYA